MNPVERVTRHTRITLQSYIRQPGPTFLILFINSTCNMRCEHCFYWSSLNKRDDLTRDEIFALSASLGPLETLNLSGGEPFLREEFAEICRRFVQRNGVRQIYVPTHASFTERTVAAITDVLR